jgi:hypothetical protein
MRCSRLVQLARSGCLAVLLLHAVRQSSSFPYLRCTQEADWMMAPITVLCLDHAL